MALTYDAVSNIVQTPVAIGGQAGLVVAPLTNAAVQPNIFPQGAPNTLAPKTGLITTAAFQFSNTNGSGQIISVVTNPA